MTTTTSSILIDSEPPTTFSLIWLDSNPNENHEIAQKLSSIVDDFKGFQDVQLCQEYIQQTPTNERLFLIVSGSLGREIVPSIQQLPQVISIYVYCLDKSANETWCSDFAKVKGVLTHADDLVHRLEQDHKIQKHFKEPLSINIFSADGGSTTKLDGLFVFSQVLIDRLLRLKSTDTDKNEFFTLYQKECQGKPSELKHLNELQNTYSPEYAIWWYTRESFFYRIINTTLRKKDIHMMFLLRTYIFDIYQLLKEHQPNDILKAYRSQIMPKDELRKLKQYDGQLISINSFFSASQDRKLAIHMLGDPDPRVVDWERILFEIDADPKTNKTKPFADISRFSSFPNESEILFMTGSIFHVNKITCDTNQIWIVEMTLCNDRDYDLKDVLKDMKKQVRNEETNLRRLGKILSEIGEFHLAKYYFTRFLNQLPVDDHLHVDLYKDLAKLASQMQNHEESMNWKKKLLEFKKQNPFSSSIRSSVELTQIQYSDLKFDKEIGSGGFGKIYLATWLTFDIPVAVKKLHSTHLNENAEKIFRNELELLNRIRHPHIITLHGACLEKEHYALVMEYMPLGSLYQLLHLEKIRLLWSKRWSISLQIARAINYLHQHKPQILHRDIKSLNILLEKTRTGYFVKVCDFGVAKTRYETTSNTTTNNMSVAYTLSWTAPEILCIETYTDKSDIYSLGIVYWELASHQIPYSGHQNDIIRTFVIARNRLKIPSDTPSNFCAIIEQCWAHEPGHRPTSANLLKMLNEYVQKQRNDSISFSETTNDTVVYDSEIGIDSATKTESAKTVSKRSTSSLGDRTRKKIRRRYEQNQQILRYPQVRTNFKWKQHATIICGEKGEGTRLDQLNEPHSIYIDDDEQVIFIADFYNHRIIKWKFNANIGQIIGGENGAGDEVDQLSEPTDLFVDHRTKSLIICDHGNRRVVRWSMENSQDKQILISNIDCFGLMMNAIGDLFVSDWKNHVVKKWRQGEREGTVVAGGNDRGYLYNQLNEPSFIFVDQNDTVYISDSNNHRVVKWMKGSSNGIIVAGGNGEGNSFKQLHSPLGISVNNMGDIYVVDSGNNRVMCWSSESKEGRVVVGGNGHGEGLNQTKGGMGLSFDRQNNLYVVDCFNSRVLRFDVDEN